MTVVVTELPAGRRWIVSDQQYAADVHRYPPHRAEYLEPVTPLRRPAPQLEVVR